MAYLGEYKQQVGSALYQIVGLEERLGEDNSASELRFRSYS